MTIVTRFAPSPTGYLHLGHAYSAMLAWRYARKRDGLIHLRIEDIDQTRCRPEFETAIHEDLAWLGLDWDPPLWRQSERMAEYETRLQTLIDRGLVYRCFKSRKELEEMSSAPHGPLGMAVTPGPMGKREERERLAHRQPFAWRLNMARCRELLGGAFDDLTYVEEVEGQPVTHYASPSRFGDVVLGRKDSGTSYHLASVHDDIALGVTHVIRGEDLADAAGLHSLLYLLFDAPAPVYLHHPLITDDDGKRLAKRNEAATLRSLREEGRTPEEVAEMLDLPLS